MTQFEKIKAEVVVRLRWIGWLLTLALAGGFVGFNLSRVTLNVIVIEMSAPGAVIFAGLFLIGWHAGAIFHFTADKVKEIEQKYRDKMVVPAGEGATTAASVASAATAAPAASAPAAVAAAEPAAPAGPVSGPQEAPQPMTEESSDAAARSPEKGG